MTSKNLMFSLCSIAKYWIAISLFSLTACNTSFQPTIQLTEYNSATSSQIFTTERPVEQFAATPTISITSTVTPQSTVSLVKPVETSKLTIYPTSTVTPILSVKEQEALVIDLLHHNSGCKLPCWWGINPRKTDWETAQEIFAEYGLSLSSYPASEEQIFRTGFYLTEYSFSVGLTIFLQSSLIHVIQAHAETTPGPWERIYGDPFYLEAMQFYLLPNMLSVFGMPQEVLIYNLNARDPVAPDYFILLFFPKAGVLIQYEGQSEETEGVLRLCPQTAMVTMWLWSPEEIMTLADVYSYEVYISRDVQMRFLERFLPLEKAASINIENFYAQFSDQHKCLETPKSLWGR